MKVYVVYYMYTETYCSPYEENWEKCEQTLLATTDHLLAKVTAENHNKTASFSKQAEIKTYDVVVP